MNPDSRRILTATFVCLLVLWGWMQLARWLYPPPPAAPTPVASDTPPSATEPVPTAAAGGASTTPPSVAAPTETGIAAVLPAAPAEPVELGIDAPREGSSPNPYLLWMKLSPRGAAIEQARLTDARNDVARTRRARTNNYDLLRPIPDPIGGREYLSFATQRVVLLDQKAEIDLSDVPWSVEVDDAEGSGAARFSTTVQYAGRPMLGITKTYRLNHDSRIVNLEYAIDNLSSAPVQFTVTQGGPMGLRREDLRWDDRHAYVLQTDGSLKALPRKSVHDTEQRETPFVSDPDKGVRWTAVGNKYFACLMAPVPSGTATRADFVRKASARTLVESPPPDRGDLTLLWVIAPPAPLPPGTRFTSAFACYMGGRTRRFMDDATSKRFDFARIYAADRSPCTFEWLAVGINKLFTLLHHVLPGRHNYGFAIIILVLIVRTILHPLTKRAQVNTFRMQKTMATFQPKMEALKQKYGNDKQKLQAEMLELYRQEGVNPAAGSFLSCLPILLQMPVWVALWSTLNSSIELRHEPFVPLQFWIPDLAAPDAVWRFGFSFKIPLLSDFMMIGDVSSLNILPILMGLTMYLQQKYSMKLNRPAVPPPTTPSEPGKPSMADQLAMQQKMMNYMTIFFALMFYNFPSGLSVYILTSSLFAMVEQRRIRRQIDRMDAEGKFRPKPRDANRDNGKPPGWLERMQKMAEDARQVRNRAPRG